MKLETVELGNFSKIPFDINVSLLKNQWLYFLQNPTGAKPSKLPSIGQVCYVNLGIGYPSELYGGHWCYVYKKLSSTKLLVVPLTSVKETSKEANVEYQIDIQVEKLCESGISRLQLSDMRCIDTQRIYVRKGFFNILDNHQDIEDKVVNTLR